MTRSSNFRPVRKTNYALARCTYHPFLPSSTVAATQILLQERIPGGLLVLNIFKLSSQPAKCTLSWHTFLALLKSLGDTTSFTEADPRLHDAENGKGSGFILFLS